MVKIHEGSGQKTPIKHRKAQENAPARSDAVHLQTTQERVKAILGGDEAQVAWLKAHRYHYEDAESMARFLAIGRKFFPPEQDSFLVESLHALQRFVRDHCQAGTTAEVTDALCQLIEAVPPRPGFLLTDTDTLGPFHSVESILRRTPTTSSHSFGDRWVKVPQRDTQTPPIPIDEAIGRYVGLLKLVEGAERPVKLFATSWSEQNRASVAFDLVHNHLAWDAPRTEEFKRYLALLGEPNVAWCLMADVEQVDESRRSAARDAIVARIRELPAGQEPDDIARLSWYITLAGRMGTDETKAIALNQSLHTAQTELCGKFSSERHTLWVDQIRPDGEHAEAAVAAFIDYYRTMRQRGLTTELADEVLKANMPRAAVVELLNDPSVTLYVPRERFPELLQISRGELESAQKLSEEFGAFGSFDGRARVQQMVREAGLACPFDEVEERIRMLRVTGREPEEAIRVALQQLQQGDATAKELGHDDEWLLIGDLRIPVSQ